MGAWGSQGNGSGGGVSSNRSLTAGAGLTGGGDLSADRSFAVGQGAGITVSADDVALTIPVAPTSGGTGLTAASTGDLLYASGADTWARRAAGANGHVLTLSGGVPTWAAASGGGTWSLVDQLAGYMTSSNNDLTSATGFSVSASGKTATGVRFYYPEPGIRNIKVTIWDVSGPLATATASVSGAGIKTISFGAPLALTPGRAYLVSIWETSGTKYYLTGSVVPMPTTPVPLGTTLITATNHWSAGDTYPGGNTVEQYAVEAVIQ